MKRASFGAVLALAATSVVLAGCSYGTPGQAEPTTTSDPASGAPVQTSISPSRAPRVANPLDASRFISDPCSSLTSADVIGLGVLNSINGGGGRNAGGVGCDWTGSPGGSVSIGWETADTGGLSDLYAKSDTIAYWQPVTVDGYPAAYGDVISDGRALGDCELSVAVNDHLFFMSSFDNPANANQSCALAKQAAADVIRNLRGS